MQTKRKAKAAKVVLISVLAGIVAAVAMQLIYTYSGSNQWESLGEKNGVTVHSMKSPGTNLKKFKATWKMHSTLSKFVMFSDSKIDLGNGFYDVRDIEQPSEKILWNTWKLGLPAPFKPRQFVVKNEFSQDPGTKELLYTVTSTPDKIPPDDCCVRVAVMNNVWRLTPRQNGEIDVEWYVDMDLGVPYLMANAAGIQGMYDFAPKLQGYLDRDQFKNAKYDWIQEAQP